MLIQRKTRRQLRVIRFHAAVHQCVVDQFIALHTTCLRSARNPARVDSQRFTTHFPMETLGQQTCKLQLDIAAVAQNPSSWIMKFDYDILWSFPIYWVIAYHHQPTVVLKSSRPWWWLQHGELCPNHPLGSSLSTRWSRWWGPAVPQYVAPVCGWKKGARLPYIIHISYIYIPAGILIWLLSATSLHGQITIWLFNIAMENPL